MLTTPLPTALVLLATPFVVGTFGDLLGVVFVNVDESGLRVGVVRAVVDDAPNDVFAPGLYKFIPINCC